MFVYIMCSIHQEEAKKWCNTHVKTTVNIHTYCSV